MRHHTAEEEINEEEILVNNMVLQIKSSVEKQVLEAQQTAASATALGNKRLSSMLKSFCILRAQTSANIYMSQDPVPGQQGTAETTIEGVQRTTTAQGTGEQPAGRATGLVVTDNVKSSRVNAVLVSSSRSPSTTIVSKTDALKHLLMMISKEGGQDMFKRMVEFDPLLVSPECASKIREICQQLTNARAEKEKM